MKKTVVKIFISILLLAAASVVFCACGKSPNKYKLEYDDAAWRVGSRVEAEGIRSVEIEWLAGEIYFESAEGESMLSAYETPLSDDEAYVMRTLIEDGILRVKCAAPGSYELGGKLVKTLHVRVPASVCLNDVEVSGGDGDVHIRGVKSKRFDVRTFSGSIVMDPTADDVQTAPRNISLSADSGNIWLNVTHDMDGADGEGGTVYAATSSGSLDVKINASVSALSLRTISGEIKAELNGEILSEMDVATRSANVEIIAKVAPRRMNVDAQNSDVYLKLRDDAAFELVTDATIAESMAGLSAGEQSANGYAKYSYRPEEYLGATASEYSVQGKNSVLHIEKFSA